MKDITYITLESQKSGTINSRNIDCNVLKIRFGNSGNMNAPNTAASLSRCEQ